MRGTRVLLGVVIGLGVLIVLGTTVIVVTVVRRVAARHATPAALPAQPAGERIVGLAAADGRLAVALSGPDGDRLLLVDPASGQVVGHVSLAP